MLLKQLTTGTKNNNNMNNRANIRLHYGDDPTDLSGRVQGPNGHGGEDMKRIAQVKIRLLLLHRHTLEVKLRPNMDVDGGLPSRRLLISDNHRLWGEEECVHLSEAYQDLSAVREFEDHRQPVGSYKVVSETYECTVQHDNSKYEQYRPKMGPWGRDDRFVRLNMQHDTCS